MPTKKGKKKRVGLGSIPLDKTVGVLDAIGKAFIRYIDHRYRIESRFDEFVEETEKKAEELKEEAIHSAYAVKKALIRSIVEVIFLATGLLSLIVGAIMILDSYVGIEYILFGYGLLVTIIVIFQMKTS